MWTDHPSLKRSGLCHNIRWFATMPPESHAGGAPCIRTLQLGQETTGASRINKTDVFYGDDGEKIEARLSCPDYSKAAA
eukprot:Skav233876  [mRNA]  locus=scaffold1483:161467:164569:+ [translate_table: standard]